MGSALIHTTRLTVVVLVCSPCRGQSINPGVVIVHHELAKEGKGKMNYYNLRFTELVCSFSDDYVFINLSLSISTVMNVIMGHSTI